MLLLILLELLVEERRRRTIEKLVTHKGTVYFYDRPLISQLSDKKDEGKGGRRLPAEMCAHAFFPVKNLREIRSYFF